MNVFITGAGGFIGKQLLEHIAADGRFEKIYCLWRRESDLPAPFITVRGSLEELANIQPIDADICIHLAAVTDSTVSADEDMFKINADGTAQVVDFCRKSHIAKIIFLSSIMVYLSEKYTYADSKLAAEEHIKNAGIEYAILRCSLVYGKGCPSFDKIVRFAKCLHFIPVLGNGKAYEQPIYMDEVCRTILHHATQKQKSGIFDLFGKEKMTYNEMVKRIAAAAGHRVFLLHLPALPFRFVSAFCARHNLPFPIQPEQIAHMCEDLHSRGQQADATQGMALDGFEENLRKYM